MKIVLFIFLLCIFYSPKQFAQEDIEYSTITWVEQMPVFNNGDLNNFLLWIYQNITYPQSAISDSTSGRVHAKFRVDSIGNVDNVEILGGVRWDLDNEVIRVIESSPKWVPGMQSQEGIGFYFTIPIDFSIKDTEFAKRIKSLKKITERNNRRRHNR